MNASEAITKIEKLRALLRECQAAGILVTKTANFAWLTGGKDNRVVYQNSADR